jgi:hypothetical protein
MKKIIMSVAAFAAIGTGVAFADDIRNGGSIQPDDLGVVEAPVAGSTAIRLEDLPGVIKHAALVTCKAYEGRSELVSAQLDKDEVEATYEVRCKTKSGKILEVDILADATVVELEIEINERQVPQNVKAALRQFFPTFIPANERPAIEKSVRPSKNGLPEIWYEFGGSNFDVEVRSDAKSLLVEPA